MSLKDELHYIPTVKYLILNAMKTRFQCISLSENIKSKKSLLYGSN